MLPAGITIDPQASRVVTLDDCNSVTLWFEQLESTCTMMPSVRIWRRKGQRWVVPVDVERITDLRPGDLVRHHHRLRRVERMVLHNRPQRGRMATPWLTIC